MPAALIQVNYDFVDAWVNRRDLTFITIADTASNQSLSDRIQEEVTEANEKFGHWEQIKKFEITPDEWTIDAGHLTPTMKMKRKVIKEIYKDLIEKIYRP